MRSISFKEYLNELKWSDERKWRVPSSSNPDKFYTVALSDEGVWGCSCPRWKMSGGNESGNVRRECKHIRKVKSENPEHVHGKPTVQSLKALGYTEEQIKNMTPEQMDAAVENAAKR